MIPKELLAKIKKIEIHTKKLLSGMLIGDKYSTQKGYGLEFDQIREYQLGDDIRYIDWNSSARMDKMLVKEYKEDRSCTIMLLVDVSESSYFGSKSSDKFAKIAEIASVLALSANATKDRVGLLLFSDTVELFIPPKTGKAHVRAIMTSLFNCKPHAKKTTIKVALNQLAKLKRKDCIAFVISDFIDNDFLDAFKTVSKAYDLVAIRCFDASEKTFPNVGFLELEDIETGNVVLVDTAKKIGGMNYFLPGRLETQKNEFNKIGIDSFDVLADRPFITDLISFFQGRIRT